MSDGLVEPLNAPAGAPTPVGVQPGVSGAVIVANRVIVYGPGGGIFVYSGTPAAGSLIYSIAGAGGTDPYGNVYFAGATSYGADSFANVNDASISFAAAAGAATVGLDTAGQLDINAPGGLTIGSLGATFIPPSGDATGATDSANIQQALNSGICLLSGGGGAGGAQYWTDGPLTLTSNTFFDGLGSHISPGSGWAASGTAGMLELQSGATANTLVRDLWLKDTYSQAGLNGVYYNAGNSVPDNHLRHVTCYGFEGSGFVLAAGSDSSSAHVADCVAYGNLGDGFQLNGDQLVTNCEAGFNMGHGFHFMPFASNTYVSGCLSWYSGVNPRNGTWPATGTSCGYFADQDAQYIRISGSWAQQNGLHGYAIGATSGGGGFTYQVSVTGGGGDTNGAYGAGVTAHGVFISGAFSATLTAVGGDNNSGLSPGSQQYGIFYAGNCQGSQLNGNTVLGSAGLVGSAAGAGPVAGGTWTNLALSNGWAAGTGVVPKYRLLVSPPRTWQIAGTLNGAAATSAVFSSLPSAPASSQSFQLADTTLASAGQYYGICSAGGLLVVEGNSLINGYTFSGLISLDA